MALEAFGGPAAEHGDAIELMPAAVRNALASSPLQVNRYHRGVLLTLIILANPGGAQSLAVFLQARDTLAGADLSISAGTPQGGGGAVGNAMLLVYPGVEEGTISGLAVNREARAMVLPRSWFVTVVPSGAGNWTYSLSGMLLS